MTDLLEDKRRMRFSTTLHKIRAHTNIRGYDRADVAAKLAVTTYESLSESQILGVDIGEIATTPHR